jgi:hypothetical protein
MFLEIKVSNFQWSRQSGQNDVTWGQAKSTGVTPSQKSNQSRETYWIQMS